MGKNAFLLVIPPKKWYGKVRYKTTKDTSFGNYNIPKDFIFDGASVNRWLSPLGAIVIIAGGGSTALNVIGLSLVLAPAIMPRAGSSIFATLLHDYLYRETSKSKKECDLAFKEELKKTNTPRWRVELIYAGVRLFGFFSFAKARRNG